MTFSGEKEIIEFFNFGFVLGLSLAAVSVPFSCGWVCESVANTSFFLHVNLFCNFY